MLVDNPIQQPSYFTTASFTDYSTDLSDIFHTELFSNSNNHSNYSNSPATASTSSRASSPQSLLTPPQPSLPTSFPDIHASDHSGSLFFNFLDDELKVIDPMSMPSSAPYDFIGAFGNGLGMNMNLGMGMDQGVMSIDPQLVGTPSTSRAMSDFGEDEPQQQQQQPEEKEKEKLTLTIAPVKVAGHGKARKGTVASGGIVKKTASSVSPKEKENSSTLVKKSSPPAKGPPGDDGDDDDDDLPQDWRPSPEVFAKMTSKEKRQLRNKISARNFRVRRKEYISTLEGDVAERDRLIDAIRSELGSTQSENLALRQEIAALKKTLLEGRGVDEPPILNLPPPAPLPTQSAAAALAANALTSSNTNKMTPNTQKDLPTSPRLGQPTRGFWGGVGMGIGMGGITPVHTVLMPEMSPFVGAGIDSGTGVNSIHGRYGKGLQENLNPSLNGHGAIPAKPQQSQQVQAFDGFADLNPFTMKTLDAYRMHLWGKMAAQHQMHQQQLQQQHQYQQQLTGLASGIRPHFFTSSPSSSAYPTPPGSPHTTSLSLSSSKNPMGSTLSALLSGKHSTTGSAYPSPPGSPLLLGKGREREQAQREREREREREKGEQREKEQQQQREHMLYTALASQTLLKRLGTAFWDAFSGAPGSSSPAGSGSSVAPMRAWDADKVRRVLEGKAVVRVVDVEPVSAPSSPVQSARVPSSLGNEVKEKCSKCCTMILEESMRSLSIGKKA